MLSIEWNHRRLRIVQGTLSARGSVSLSRALLVPYPEGFDKTNADQAGEFLAKTLADAGIRERKAIVCVDRRSLILKTIPLLGVKPDEVPQVVRLQAMKDLTLPLEEVVIDHATVGLAGDKGAPMALAAALRRDVAALHRAIAGRVGLQLAGLCPSSLCAARITPIPRPANAALLDVLIVVDRDNIEFLVSRNGQFVMSAARSVSRSEGAAEAGPVLMPTIRRLEGSLSAWYPADGVQSVALAGLDASSPLASELPALHEHFLRPIEPIDPLASLADCGVPAEERGGFAAVVGALLVHRLAPKARIDFLAPKEVRPRRDLRRPVAIAAVGLLLLAGLSAQRFHASEQSRMSAAVKAAADKEKLMAKELRTLRPFVLQEAVIEQWRRDEVIWLDVLDRLHRTLPLGGSIFLTGASFSGGNGSSATVRIEGFATDPRDVTAMHRRLVEAGGMQVRPGAVLPADRTSEFPWRFSAEVVMASNSHPKSAAGPVPDPPAVDSAIARHAEGGVQ